jgi:hypothetical protein
MIARTRLTPDEVYRLALGAGLGHEPAVVATAIAWAESGLRPDAVGDVGLTDGTWGPSIGLWQIRSLRADTGTGKERDVERLGDPSFNARSMVAISAGGTNWRPWSVFKNDQYRDYLVAVRAAVEGGQPVPMQFVSRAEWGAANALGVTAAPGMTRGIGLHHLGDGWGPTGGIEESKAKMRWVQDFHMGPERRWNDFAYNAGADHLGNIFEGRGPFVRNAANGGGSYGGYDANAGWFAILYLGGTSGPNLTPRARDAINDYVGSLGLVGGDWLGHDDFLSTACPGPDRRRWLDAGHPRSTAVPRPTEPEPEPEPDLEVATMFIFDASPERGGGIYYTDGATWKRGVPNGNALIFYASGKVPHVGVLPDDVFDAIPFATTDRGLAGFSDADPAAALPGPLALAMERSDFETGDPGCGSPPEGSGNLGGG